MTSSIYSVVTENRAILNADGTTDIWEFSPADDQPIDILACYLTVLTEVGDTEEEMLRLQWIRGHTTIGSGGAVVTPENLKRGGDSPGFTADEDNTTIATVGTVDNLHADGMNVRIPYVFLPTPETIFGASQADTTLVLRLMAAVTDDLNYSSTVYVREHA